jgi:Holliday junction DNA helicase RuvA
MYAFVKGKIDYKGNDFSVVEAGGIGYRIFTSLKSLEGMGAVGAEVKLYTYFHVREDAMILYGFCTQEELSLFELLISVNGVGPKAAISLLSAQTPSKLSLAIVSGDYKVLKEAPGIGLKIAQRVVLELKDKIMKGQPVLAEAEVLDCSISGSAVSEAICALTVLGYSQQDAGKMVSSIFKEGMSVEDVIKAALKKAL